MNKAQVKTKIKEVNKIANRLIKKKGYRDGAMWHAGYSAGLADGHNLKRIYQ